MNSENQINLNPVDSEQTENTSSNQITDSSEKLEQKNIIDVIGNGQLVKKV